MLLGFELINRIFLYVYLILIIHLLSKNFHYYLCYSACMVLISISGICTYNIKMGIFRGIRLGLVLLITIVF